MSETTMHLIVAAFDRETGAEEAFKTMKESRDEELVGIQAAVALHKDQQDQIHLGADEQTAEIPADVDQHLDAAQEAAFAALLTQMKHSP